MGPCTEAQMEVWLAFVEAELSPDLQLATEPLRAGSPFRAAGPGGRRSPPLARGQLRVLVTRSPACGGGGRGGGVLCAAHPTSSMLFSSSAPHSPRDARPQSRVLGPGQATAQPHTGVGRSTREGEAGPLAPFPDQRGGSLLMAPTPVADLGGKEPLGTDPPAACETNENGESVKPRCRPSNRPIAGTLRSN